MALTIFVNRTLLRSGTNFDVLESIQQASGVIISPSNNMMIVSFYRIFLIIVSTAI